MAVQIYIRHKKSVRGKRKEIIAVVLLLCFLQFTVCSCRAEETVQKNNSIAMMNYLEVLTVEITSSKADSVLLKEAYDSLNGNTDPTVVSTRTQAYLSVLRDTIQKWCLSNDEWEHLNDEYQYQKSRLILNSIKNGVSSSAPSLLSMIKPVNEKEMLSGGSVVSVIKTICGSVSEYINGKRELEHALDNDKYKLDKEATQSLFEIRDQAFDYMVEIVREYGVSRDEALSEEQAEKLISDIENENVYQRIQALTSKQKLYEAWPHYWLKLAESYFEAGNYEECLKLVRIYEEKDVRIFRKDYELARVLPMAIISASDILDDNAYRELAERYAELILENSGEENWALRYFAAQVYYDLFISLRDEEFLKKTYNIVLDNVSNLSQDQLNANQTYLDNNMILPPVNTPLYINLELLWEIIPYMNLNDKEYQNLQDFLHYQDQPLFLSKPLDFIFNFEKNKWPTELLNKEYHKDMDVLRRRISYKNGQVTIPAQLLSTDAVVYIAFPDKNRDRKYFSYKMVSNETEYSLSGESDNLDKRFAKYKNPGLNKKEKDASYLLLIIDPMQDSFCEDICVGFEKEETGTWFKKTEFRNVDPSKDAFMSRALGELYEQGLCNSKSNQDLEEAIRWYILAAEQNDEAAKYSWNRIAEKVDSNLQFKIARSYYMDSEEESMQEAIKWAQKSALQDNAFAQNLLGYIYDNGFGLEQNYEEAVKWYQLSAEQGYGIAQYNLGSMYFNGRGIEQNYEEAVKWYRLAAEHGRVKAQVSLGNIYRDGLGVKQDYEEAIKWYRMAADQGNSKARNNLGDMYYGGLGVEQNYKEALKWYRLSAEQGDSYAREKLEYLSALN